MSLNDQSQKLRSHALRAPHCGNMCELLPIVDLRRPSIDRALEYGTSPNWQAFFLNIELSIEILSIIYIN